MKPRYRYVGTEINGWVSDGIGYKGIVAKRLIYVDVGTGRKTYVEQIAYTNPRTPASLAIA